MEEDNQDNNQQKNMMQIFGFINDTVQKCEKMNLSKKVTSSILNLIFSISGAKSLNLKGSLINTQLPQDKAWFFIRNYHKDIYEEKIEKNESEDHSCSICLQPFVKPDVRSELYCKHYFHKKCIQEWLTNSVLCPLCKVDFRDHSQYAQWDKNYKERIK